MHHSSKMKITFFLVFLLLASCTATISRSPSSSKSIKSLRSHSRPAAVSASASKVKLELFVMSQCPYGVEAEKAIIPLIKEFQDEIDFHLYFIADEANEEGLKKSPQESSLEPSKKSDDNYEQADQCHGEAVYEGGRFKSLHGRAEIDEDIRQTVIATYYPDRLLDYLLYRAENYQEDDWEQAAVSAWIDCDLLNQLVKDEGENLFLTNIKRAGELKIPASPTLLINGEKMQGPIKQWALSRQLCLQEYNFQKCRDIPVCGHDFDCNAEGRVGVCLDPDTPKARCRFSDPVKVRLEIIKATDCAACDHNSFLKWAQEIFPGIEAVEIDSNSSEGKKLIEDYSIHALPAYFFDPNIQKTARYHVIKEQLNQKKDRFLLSNNQIKVSSLIDRPLQKESLAIFTEGFSFLGLMAVRKIINSSLPDSAAFTAHLLAQTLDQDNDTNPRVLNLVPGKDNELVLTPQQSKVVFQAPGGLKEIQEDMRQVCLAHHYPNLYLPYLKCIAGLSSKQIEEGKWQDCLKEINLDEKDLVPCTHGKEGVDLLLKEIDLADHLGIQKSPTYLINNKVLLKEAPPDFALYIYHQMNSQESKN